MYNKRCKEFRISNQHRLLMCRSTATKYVYYIYLLPSAIQPVTSGTAVENSSGEVLVERVSLLEEEGGLSLEGGSLGGGGTLEGG